MRHKLGNERLLSGHTQGLHGGLDDREHEQVPGGQMPGKKEQGRYAYNRTANEIGNDQNRLVRPPIHQYPCKRTHQQIGQRIDTEEQPHQSL
ncbi:hypothetical protein D3C73_1512940 [compost metagenome]